MHFLNKDELFRTEYLPRRHAAAEVELKWGAKKSRSLHIRSGVEVIVIAKDGIGLCPLPEKVPVFDSKGSQIKPTWRFYVSTETFNPFHLLLDVDMGRF